MREIPGNRFAAALAAAAVLAVVAGPADALPQAQPRPPRQEARAQDGGGQGEDPAFRIGAELVLLDVSVVDRANRPVFNLPKERFTISEDNVPQKVEFFNKEEAPISLGLLVDTSGSMRPKIETVIEAVTNLIKGNRALDETAVVEFKDQIELIEEFTTNERDVEDALEDLIANGQSALLDGIKLASEYVQKEGRHRRKALLVVSDGLEKGSYFTYEQVAGTLKELDVRLYLIGFTQDLDQSSSIFKKSPKKRAEELLLKLAEDSGGRAFFPKDLAELGPIGEEIATDLRTVYAIGYYPTNDKKDGTFRKVQVKITGDAKAVARTRAGYYAEKQ